MVPDAPTNAPDGIPITWGTIRQSLNRPYPVTFPMVLLVSLVPLSTLFTKQHYVADLVAGVLLALAAYAVFLRGYSRANVPELHRRLAPALALCVGGFVALGVARYWVAYRLGVGS